MKTSNNFLFITVVLLVAYLLSACGGVPTASPGANGVVKVDASMIAYTGIIESIDGDQWVVSGETLTIDPTVVSDGPFQVGDTVKIEGSVEQDGSFTVSSVEAPSSSDLTELPQLGDENVNANSNDDNTNDDNSNDGNINTNDNSNTDNSNENGNDNANESSDDGQEVYGVVEAITEDSITIDGVTYNFADFTEFNGTISMGDQVKIEFIVNADGTLTVYEIEQEDDAADNSNFNSNSNDSDDDDDDNSNTNSNSNDSDDDDDNSNDDNSNDDDSNDDSSVAN